MISPHTNRLETPMEALRRELREETGLDLNLFRRGGNLKLEGDVLVQHPTKAKFSHGSIYSISLGHDYQNEINQQIHTRFSNGEITEIKFFDLDELSELLDNPEQNLYRPDINDGLIRWWARNKWVHDYMCDELHDDGPITEDIIKMLAEEKMWL